MFKHRLLQSRHRKALALTVAVILTASGAVASAATPGLGALAYSSKADRSAPQSLKSAKLSGSVYIFLNRDKASRVVFSLDGKQVSVENVAPYDLEATAANGTANPLDTKTLTNGVHRVSAAVTTLNQRTVTYSAQFTVSNTAPGSGGTTTTTAKATTTTIAPATTTTAAPTTTTAAPTTSTTVRATTTTTVAPTSDGCSVPSRLTVTTANQSSYPAYPVNTKLYVPMGPDPWGGCFPGPNNTGVPAGTQLTDYTGPCTITSANTVIDKQKVNCVLDIRAQGVKITNSLINGRVYVDDTRCASISSANGTVTNPGTASFTITDSTVITNDINFRSLMYCNYTATRVDLSGGGSQAICINCTIQDSYLHNPQEDPTGHAHNSTVRMGPKGNLIHNTLWCNVRDIASTDGSGDVSGCSANQTAYSHDATVAYYDTMKRNYYAGIPDGYCAYGGSTGGAGAGLVSNMKFIENVFQRGTTNAGWTPPAYMCGYYGPITSLDLTRPGNEFTSNIWDNGKPVGTEQTTWSTNPNNPTTAAPCYGAPSFCTW